MLGSDHNTQYVPKAVRDPQCKLTQDMHESLRESGFGVSGF